MQQTELQMRNAYEQAVELWIAGIKEEEALALANPTVWQVDNWEQSHFKEEGLRTAAKQAKKDYEAAIRQNLFQF